MNKYLQENSPQNLFFKASNILVGQKVPIHKSKAMVSSIVAAIYHTSPYLVKNNFNKAAPVPNF